MSEHKPTTIITKINQTIRPLRFYSHTLCRTSENWVRTLGGTVRRHAVHHLLEDISQISTLSVHNKSVPKQIICNPGSRIKHTKIIGKSGSYMRPFGVVISIFVMGDENTKPETWDILLRWNAIIDMSRHIRHVWRTGRRLVRQTGSWQFRRLHSQWCCQRTCGDSFFLSFFFLSNLRWWSSKTGPTRSFLSFVDVCLFVDRYLLCCGFTIL